MKKRILLIDDNRPAQAFAANALSPIYDVDSATTAEESLKRLATVPPDLILLDLLVSEDDGMALLQTLRRDHPWIPVIMLTSLASIKAAVTAMQLGADDYLTKPVDPNELRSAVVRTLDSHAVDRELHVLRTRVRARHGLHNLIGKSPGMLELYKRIELAASTRATVLINGESGTGKELVARALHEYSPRRERPFVGVNCAAIPEHLLESEFFGHERGAFTDAHARRTGHFELAHGGTLFLDEIGELTLAMQAKLLRALQEREFRRVGGSQPVQVDVRIVTATNRNLFDLVAQGRFREDIYYRLNVIPLFLPPLRERRQDIPLLANHFLTKGSRTGRGKPPRIDRETLDLLMRYDWPGNVRELENILEQASVWCRESSIQPDHLPAAVRKKARILALSEASLSGSLSLEQAVQEFERDIIVDALRRRGYVQTRTARLLGITRRQLKYRMDALGLCRPSGNPASETASAAETGDGRAPTPNVESCEPGNALATPLSLRQ